MTFLYYIVNKLLLHVNYKNKNASCHTIGDDGDYVGLQCNLDQLLQWAKEWQINAMMTFCLHDAA